MKKLFAVFLALVALPALAQFKANVSGGAGSVRLTIEPTGPGAANLVFTNTGVTYLNSSIKFAGVPVEPDASGKGTVQNVPFAKAGLAAGTEFCVSGVGRGGYAVKGKTLDRTLSACAPFGEKTVIPVTAEDGVIGFTLVAVGSGDQVLGNGIYPSHPPQSVVLANGRGSNDMTLVLSTKAGKIGFADEGEINAYKPVYKAVTAAK